MRWEWDEAKIENMNFTENVIAFLLETVFLSHPHIQALLKFTSVIGNTFDSTLLTSFVKKYIFQQNDEKDDESSELLEIAYITKLNELLDAAEQERYIMKISDTEYRYFLFLFCN